MLLQLVYRCLNSVTNKFFYAILGLTLLATLAIFAGFYISTNAFITHYTEDLFWPLSSIVDFLGSSTSLLLSYFLFPLTFPIISSLFAEKIFVHMESKHYHISINPRINSFAARMIESIKFVVKALFLNLLALPLYLIPIIGIVLYYYINAYLFGKEYFDMTAHRYSEIKTAKQDYKTNRFSILSTGLLICLMSTFPIINLFAPILAIIIMAHLYHTKISKLNYHK